MNVKMKNEQSNVSKWRELDDHMHNNNLYQNVQSKFQTVPRNIVTS